MANGKRFRSLTFKLVFAVCIGVACALVTFLIAALIGRAVVNELYLSEDAVNNRLRQEVSSFRQYVTDNRVSSTNVSAIGQWNREHRFVQLTVYGQTTTINSDSSGAELVGNEYGVVIRDKDSSEGAVDFPVNFIDGVFTVSIYDATAWLYMGIVVLTSLILSVLVFLSVILVYDQHITRTVQTLSRQVRQVSRGDLQMKIQPMSRDEIGQLALDVDTMRLSIIDKLQREEAAWKANTQLITAISHDVRTPLTALMGYLEILSDESIAPEERQAYLQVCKNNATRLKGLTDELFGFFLVFGSPSPDQSPEEFDGAMLLEQILMEHEMNLFQHGFQVERLPAEPVSGMIRVDLTHLRRVFDNLFSNVLKYASPENPVTILLGQEHEDIRVVITNHIAVHSDRVESNRIGLQTCHKLVHAMGGEFSQHRTRETFSVEVLLPLMPSRDE